MLYVFYLIKLYKLQNSSYVWQQIYISSGSVIRVFAPLAGGRGFDPRPRYTKDVIKIVPDASLLRAQHIRTGLASLSSQTSLKKRKEMDTIRNERSHVI